MIMDYDLTPARSDPADAVIDDAFALMRRAFAGMGRDTEVGVRMPSLFVAAGVGAPDGCDVSSTVVDGHEGVSLLKTVLRSLRPAIEKLELRTPEALASMVDKLEKISPAACFVRRPDMVATWKTKPAERAEI